MIEEKFWAKIYYHTMNKKYDDEVINALYFSHAEYFLNRQNLEKYFLIIDRKHINCFNLLKEDINHIPLYMLEYERDYPEALDDDHHTGHEGHVAFARDILKYINYENYIQIPFQQKLTFFQKIIKNFTRIKDEIRR